MNMYHLDIKPQNILIFDYDKYNEYICFSDFGTVI